MNHDTMHLFAGAGGGLLSDLILGNRPIVAVEWDKYACSILRARAADGWFPNLHVFEGDVRLFDPSEYPGRIHSIHAGFPCTDVSVAGKQAGVGEGTRSGLYREVLRIADVVRPRELFLENVAAILSNGLGTVLADLSARGYSARWVCIRASDVGANHQRDRWWLLARKLGNPEHTGQPAPKVTGSPAQRSDDCTTRAEQASEFTRPGEQYADVANTNTGNAERGQGEKPAHVADPNNKRELQPEGLLCDERGRTSDKGQYVPDSNNPRLQGCEKAGNNGKNRTESGHEQPARCDRVQGDARQIEPDICCMADELSAKSLPGWWDIEPAIGRTTDVSKDRANQLRALGNAQVPLQAAVAYTMLRKLFGETE